MFGRASTSIRVLLLIAASVLVFAIAADQFPELLALQENTSNDFTIHKQNFSAYVLMVSLANHASKPLNPEGSDHDKDNWVRRPPTCADGKAFSDDLLLLSVLRT